MDIEVKVDKEAVERAVSAAIVQSALAPCVISSPIAKGANALMKDAMAVGSYGKPDGVLRRVVEAEMTEICRKVFLEEYTEKVTEAVRQLVTDDVINSIVAKAWGEWIGRRDRW
jgi:hypothetical protein